MLASRVESSLRGVVPLLSTGRRVFLVLGICNPPSLPTVSFASFDTPAAGRKPRLHLWLQTKYGCSWFDSCDCFV